MPDMSGLSSQITQGANAVFNRVNNALAERGYESYFGYVVCPSQLTQNSREMLDTLQDQVKSLEQGSRNMANQVSFRIF